MNSKIKRILGVVILIVGLISLGILINNALRDFPVWFFGEEVSGEIIDNWIVKVNPDDRDDLEYLYFVQYSFVTAEGETVIGESNVSPSEFSGTGKGTSIMISYSVANPENNRIDDSQYRSMLICSYLPILLVSFFALLNGLKMIKLKFKKDK